MCIRDSVGDDLDTLGKLATPMSDNEKSYIGVVSQYYDLLCVQMLLHVFLPITVGGISLQLRQPGV